MHCCRGLQVGSATNLSRGAVRGVCLFPVVTSAVHGGRRLRSCLVRDRLRGRDGPRRTHWGKPSQGWVRIQARINCPRGQSPYARFTVRERSTLPGDSVPSAPTPAGLSARGPRNLYPGPRRGSEPDAPHRASGGRRPPLVTETGCRFRSPRARPLRNSAAPAATHPGPCYPRGPLDCIGLASSARAVPGESCVEPGRRVGGPARSQPGGALVVAGPRRLGEAGLRDRGRPDQEGRRWGDPGPGTDLFEASARDLERQPKVQCRGSRAHAGHRPPAGTPPAPTPRPPPPRAHPAPTPHPPRTHPAPKAEGRGANPTAFAMLLCG
jgi:hypothetical protein